jgi:hypothetical protein
MNIAIKILDIVHRHVYYLKHQLKSIGLSVTHSKRMSPLEVQQVNAIYRFVTMVY